jgi:hypothetical protein
MTPADFIDRNLDNIIASLPNGMNGFLKSWGLQHFGVAALTAFLNEAESKIKNRDHVSPQNPPQSSQSLQMGEELDTFIDGRRVQVCKEDRVSSISDEQIEALAIKHEDFGFGRVDKRGITTHGFNPEGLRAFVLEIVQLCR